MSVTRRKVVWSVLFGAPVCAVLSSAAVIVCFGSDSVPSSGMSSGELTIDVSFSLHIAPVDENLKETTRLVWKAVSCAEPWSDRVRISRDPDLWINPDQKTGVISVSFQIQHLSKEETAGFYKCLSRFRDVMRKWIEGRISGQKQPPATMTAGNAEQAQQSTSVTDLQRPETADLIFLKNGSMLIGTVLNETISVSTSYVVGLKLRTKMLAGILFEGQGYRERVITINANRISGFINDPAIVVKPDEGPSISIRKEKISKIVFRKRASELSGVQRNDILVLHNGDLLTGVILNRMLHLVDSTPTVVSVKSTDVAHVAMASGQNALTKLTLKRTGGMIQGIFLDEDIRVDLDCGPVVKIYQDRIREISFQRGAAEKVEFHPAGMNISAEQRLNGSSFTNSIGMRFVLIPAGEFVMGAPSNEQGSGGDERPRHRVRITKPFYMGVTEVTQAQWKAVMGYNRSHFKGQNLPVEMVSWYGALDFCRKLTEMERKAGRLSDCEEYRLPTEAEWEYACRAGTKTAYSFGDSANDLIDYAWFAKNSLNRTHPVGRKKPNPWGLYDMYGNVLEWCQDWYGEYPAVVQEDPKGPPDGNYRVVRGGCWYLDKWSCRSASRGRSMPGLAGFNNGFRVVRTVLLPGP